MIVCPVNFGADQVLIHSRAGFFLTVRGKATFKAAAGADCAVRFLATLD
jgi:hypothetical protein